MTLERYERGELEIKEIKKEWTSATPRGAAPPGLSNTGRGLAFRALADWKEA